jgi:hypothetical protein
MSRHQSIAIAIASSVLLVQAGQPAATPALAQTTASQGQPEPGPADDVKTFESPMILEIPLEPLASLLGKTWVTIEDVPRYRCEGVSLQKVRVRGTRQKSGAIGLNVKTETYTVPGKDKFADLQFELLLDGESIASELIKEVNAEEGTKRHVSSYLEVPVGKSEVQDKPVLRITVTVTDN